MENRLDNIWDLINAGGQAIDLAMLADIQRKLNIIDNKLGPQLQGGLSGKLNRFSKWLGIDRVLNILNLWATIHNAYFLSSAIGQTLFGTIDTVLDIFKVQLKDDEGQPIDTGGLVSNALDSFFKNIFGVETWTGIKESWKAFSRTYQAAANIVRGVRSIGDSVLNALSVVGRYSAQIGNALKASGAVYEKAFGWMNPRPNFENKWLTRLQVTEEVVSDIDSIVSEVKSVQDTIKEIREQRDDLKKNIGQLENALDGFDAPEASKVKAEETEKKESSQAPETEVRDMNRSES